MYIANTYLQPSARLTSTLKGIPSGVGGVIATLDEMVKLARSGRRALPIRLAALNAVSEVPGKSYREEARAIQHYVRDRIRYVKDIRDTETLSAPEQTLEFGQGDCDDKSTLVAAMLESIGHPTRFVAVAFRHGIYEHVYVETKIGRNWISVETTEPVDFGWEPRGVVSRIVRNV